MQAGERVLLAVSGGMDSMALLSTLARLRAKHRFELFAHGVDHGLRPEAAAELDLAERFAEAVQVPFARTSLGLSPGSNLQARARRARYDALNAEAARLSATWIATGHHADDRAETVLLRLLRGSSPAAMAVLPARTGKRIRPLIRARKRDVVAHVARHRVPFAEDPSNEELRFLRVRVRKQLLPLLESLSPAIVDHLTALADDLTHHSPTSADFPRASGVELPLLGAAQRAAVRRMLDRGSVRARVRLRGGRELRLDPSSGALTIDSPPRKAERQ